MKAPTPAGRENVRHRTLLPRFRDAFAGLYQAYLEEPNLRFHFFATACVAFAARAVKVEPWEGVYLATTVALVLLAEMGNTAVERTVDLAAGGRHHPLAAQAKQVAAGAVLLAALHATAGAFYLFVLRREMWSTLHGLLSLALEEPWWVLVPVLAGLAALLGSRGSLRTK